MTEKKETSNKTLSCCHADSQNREPVQESEPEEILSCCSGDSQNQDPVQESESGEAPACCHGDGRSTKRSAEEQRSLIHRLNRMEGQVRGLKKMIEQDAYCADILVQSSAIAAALNAFNRQLLSRHIHTCVTNDIREGKDGAVDELMELLGRLMK